MSLVRCSVEPTITGWLVVRAFGGSSMEHTVVVAHGENT